MSITGSEGLRRSVVIRTLEDKRVVVTGGSRGLGLGIVEALLARAAQVTVVARDPARLADVERLRAAAWPGGVTDPGLMSGVVGDVKPRGTDPERRGGTLHGAARRAILGNVHRMGHGREGRPLRCPGGTEGTVSARRARTDRVERRSLRWKPAVGRYAGAKRMLWILAHYGNGIATERGLAIHFQVVVPQQIVGETSLGHQAASAGARRRGLSIEAFPAERYALAPAVR